MRNNIEISTERKTDISIKNTKKKRDKKQSGNHGGFYVMTRLIGLIKPLLLFMMLAIFAGLLGHLAASFITILGVLAVANILGFSLSVSITTIFILVCVLALLRGVLRYAEQACNHFIAFKLLALIRDKVFRALRKLCPAKLDGKDKGDLISVITSDIELLEVFYAHTVSPVAIACFFCFIICVFIGSYSIVSSFIALAAYLTVGVVIPIVTSRISGDIGKKFRSESGGFSGFILDSLRGLPEILQYNSGKDRLYEMNRRVDDLSSCEKKMRNISGVNQSVTNTVILFFDLLMLFTSATLYYNGRTDFLGVLVPTVALMSSFGPVIALANLGSTLQNTFAAGDRVLDILDERPSVEEIVGGKQISFKNASVQNVSFSYEDEMILEDVSVDIPKGSIVGIVGRSGSGKSTLLKLLMRFWEVDKGRVLLSGVNVNEIDTGNLRDIESFVTQDTHLFHDSIRNNLKIARRDATDSEIETACKKASVHDFIMTLPKGYNTAVGELGDTLSGGEKQRIGLARAFLHNSDLLLLDEPTSNLDSLNEAVILKALKESRDNKTVVLVSHRKSTIRIAERTYSVECGRLS